MAVLAIGREIDGVTGAFERGAKLPPERGFVLDDENAHGCGLSESLPPI